MCLLEFTALDAQLNELNRALDAIEAKNEDINGKAKELLETTRNERLQMANLRQQLESANVSNSQNNSDNRNSENDRGSVS